MSPIKNWYCLLMKKRTLLMIQTADYENIKICPSFRLLYLLIKVLYFVIKAKLTKIIFISPIKLQFVINLKDSEMCSFWMLICRILKPNFIFGLNIRQSQHRLRTSSKNEECVSLQSLIKKIPLGGNRDFEYLNMMGIVFRQIGAERKKSWLLGLQESDCM